MADRRTLILVIEAGHRMLMWCGEVRFPACWVLGEYLGLGAGLVERAVMDCDLAKLDAWARQAGGRIVALDENGRGITRAHKETA